MDDGYVSREVCACGEALGFCKAPDCHGLGARGVPTAYHKTVMTVAIHPSGVNPTCPHYDDQVITISLQDEGGGAFIELEQGDNTIRIDPDELGVIVAEARALVAQVEQDSREG